MNFDVNDYQSWLTVLVTIGVILLMTAVLLGLRLVLKAEDAASKAVVGDLVFFSAVGTVVLVGMLTRSEIVLDVVLLASLVGILATIALGRIITRGRR